MIFVKCFGMLHYCLNGFMVFCLFCVLLLFCFAFKTIVYFFKAELTAL